MIESSLPSPNEKPAEPDQGDALPARLPGDPLDERMLDLLVDGELSLAEQRELLARCDERPEAWRRCALAFLEAQAWRQEAKLMQPASGATRVQAAEPRPAVAATPVAVATLGRGVPPATHWRQMRTFLALAASLLCAFLIGLEVREHWPRGAAPSNMANVGPAAAPAKVPSAPQGQAQLVSRQNNLAGALVFEDEARQGALHVPVYSGPDVNEEWVQSLPSQVPADVRQVLERLGGRLNERRQLVPITLEDGTRVIVPVDQLEVRLEQLEIQ